MELHKPFIITSRLEAGLEIGNAIVSMRIEGKSDDGRLLYHYWVDSPDFCYENNDLRSGVGSGNLQEGFVSLLSFLSADAERYRFGDDLGPDYCFDSISLIEWAYQNSDEIAILNCEIEETPGLISD